jgi:RNA polymerase sigma factor (sigma-70 family)
VKQVAIKAVKKFERKVVTMNVANDKALEGFTSDEELKELIWRGQIGEARAIEELLRIYEQLILRISRKYYFLDGEEDDVIQECKIAFWQSVLSYNNAPDAISLESFAYICINRRLASVLRSRTKKATLFHNRAMWKQKFFNLDHYSEDKIIAVSEDNTEREYILKELREEYLTKVGNTFPAEYGNVVKMRESGYSYVEIAEKLEIPVKKVDNILTKVRKKINIKDMLD